MQTHRIQIYIQDEYNRSEIPVEMCLISDSQASLYLLLVDQLQISMTVIRHFDYYIKREIENIKKLVNVNQF